MNDNIKVGICGCKHRCAPPTTYKTIILKPNCVCGHNTLTQEMLSEKNTKYVIKYDFTLGGERVIVPEECILEFDGGSLRNGTIVGQDTVYINVGDVDIWGENLTREGTWKEHSGGGGGGHDEDRPYDPANFVSMGKKYLEKNVVNDKNILTQEMVSEDNTIYVVQYDFDLDKKRIQIPSNCVIEFDGGSITNGKIISNHTVLNNYTGNGDELFGDFYDNEGNPLSYNGKTIKEMVASEVLLTNITHDYTGPLNPDPSVPLKAVMNQQAILVTSNNIIIFGIDNQPVGMIEPWNWPWPPRIVVFDRNFNYIKTITDITNEGVHFNDVTLAGEYVYSTANRISRCLLSDILNNNSVTFEIVEPRDGDYYSAINIDYDAVSEEFCVHGLYSTGSRLRRYSKDWVLLTDVPYDYQSVLQPITYGDYIVDNSGWYKNGIWHQFHFVHHDDLDCAVPIFHVATNALTGEIIYCKPVDFGRNPYKAVEGAIKDPDNDNIIWCQQTYPANGIVKSYMITKVSETEKDSILEGAGYPSYSTDKVEEFNGKIYVDNAYSGAISDGTPSRPFKTFLQAYLTGRQATIYLAGSNTPYYIDIKLNGKPVKIVGQGKVINDTTVYPTIYGKFDLSDFSNISIAAVVIDLEHSNNMFSGYNSNIFLQNCTIANEGNLFNGAYNKYTFSTCAFRNASKLSIQASEAIFLGTNTFNGGDTTAIECKNSSRIFSNNNIFSGDFERLIESPSGEVFTFGIYDVGLINAQNLGSSDYAIKYVFYQDMTYGGVTYPKGIYHNVDGALHYTGQLIGTTLQRALSYKYKGLSCYDTDLNKPTYFNGSSWYDYAGNSEEPLMFSFGQDAVDKTGVTLTLKQGESCNIKSARGTFTIVIGGYTYTGQSEYSVPAGSVFTLKPESNNSMFIAIDNKRGFNAISYDNSVPAGTQSYNTFLDIKALEHCTVNDLYMSAIMSTGVLDLSTMNNYVENGHNLAIISKVIAVDDDTVNEATLIIPSGVSLGENFDSIRITRFSSSYNWPANPAEFDLASLHGCKNLTNLECPHASNVTGSVDDLLDAMYAAGRHSGTLTIQLGLTGCTFGGDVLDQTYVNTHGWIITATFTNDGWTATQS